MGRHEGILGARERFEAEPAYAADLAACGIASAAALLDRDWGEAVRATSRSSVHRVSLGARVFFLKRYRYPWPLAPLAGALKGNPPVLDGRREMRAIGRFRAEGLPVPDAAAAAARATLFTRESAVLLAEARGEPADRWLTRAGVRERRAFALALADLARRMHRARLCHRDLYLCHVLVGPGGPADLTLLDLQRAGPFVRERWRVKDLAALCYSARGLASRADACRFLRAYLGLARLTREAKALARRVAAKALRIARHGRKG